MVLNGFQLQLKSSRNRSVYPASFFVGVETLLGRESSVASEGHGSGRVASKDC